MEDARLTSSEEGLARPWLSPSMDFVLVGTPSACPLSSPIQLRRQLRVAEDSSLLAPLDASLFEASATDASGAWPQSLELDASESNNTMYPFLDSITGSGNNNDQWAVKLTQAPMVETERPGSPLNEDIAETYKNMTGLCVSTPIASYLSVGRTKSLLGMVFYQSRIESWQIHDPKQRLHYVVNRMKALIADVATRGASPFLHRRLYKDYTPPCIVSCFSTCVLYQNRTPDNAAMVARAIHTGVKGLVDYDFDSCAAPTPMERLARVQALFLYQIIRLFDGDVMLRAQGERDIPLLERWVGELCRVRENLGDLVQQEIDTVRMGPPQEWEVSSHGAPS